MPFLSRLFGKKEIYFDSLILLLSEPRLVDRQILLALLPSAIPTPEVEEKELGTLLVKAESYRLNIFSAPAQYGPPGHGPKFLLDRCQDMRLKDRILGHRAFISINSDGKTPEPLRAETRRITTLICAALIDDTTVAVMDAITNRVFIPSKEAVEHLSQGNRSAAWETMPDPVIGVNPEAVESGVAEAQRRYPEFVAAFRRAKPKSVFIVKMKFTDPGRDHVEHMWIEPIAVDENHITGTLTNEPHRLRSVRKGDTVTKPVSDLSDWAFAEDGKPCGMFTDKAVRES